MMRRIQTGRGLAVPLVFSSLGLGQGCTGELGAEGAARPGGGAASGGTTGEGPRIEDCGSAAGFDAGLTKLRRLTRQQVDNTIRDLFGVEAEAERTLSPDERMGPFYSNAIAPVTSLQVQQAQELAARVARAVEPRMAEIVPCDLAAAADLSCAETFVETFGERAYRRPLEAEEVDALVRLYELGSRDMGAANGFRLVIEAMLQSPSFLYHVEVGEAGTPSALPVPITPFGLAARLSYFLWNTLPDVELFELAASGALADEGIVAQQVQRLLAHPRAATTIASFHMQWLGLTSLVDVSKDPNVYPDFDEALVEEMIEETARFAEYVVREGDGRLETLLTASFGFPGERLERLYGVQRPPGASPGDPVPLDSTQRSGILTLAGFLAKHAHGDQSSPVHRGMIVRENVLCQPIPPPPANVDGAPPTPTEVDSTRERFAQHVADPSCASCHKLIDPPGLAFEHYDAIGAYRTIDGLGPVDATGELIGVREDLAGSFDGAIELTRKLASSSEVAECVSRQWFRFALGRVESQNDVCSIHSLQERLQSSGGDIRALLTQVALSDAFRHVRATAEEN